jgi:hypothetical protein
MGKLQIKWNIFFLFLASTYCLSLSYHMKGSPGSLSIAAGESEQSSTVVWQKSGNQGNGWLTTAVDIPAFATPVVSNNVCLFDGV